MSGFKVKLNKRGITDEELIEDIQRVAKIIGKNTLQAREYTEHGGSVTTVRRRFNTWNEALKRAGLEIENRQNIPDEELIENFVNIWQKLGRQPVGRDLLNNENLSSISLGTYEKRYGSWNNFLIKFQEYVENGDVPNSRQESLSGNSTLNTRRTDRRINLRLRYKILSRDNFKCKSCGASPAKNPNVVLHVDHIKAWANGGETIENNLQTLCSICNVGKSDEEF